MSKMTLEQFKSFIQTTRFEEDKEKEIRKAKKARRSARKATKRKERETYKPKPTVSKNATANKKSTDKDTTKHYSGRRRIPKLAYTVNCSCTYNRNTMQFASEWNKIPLKVTRRKSNDTSRLIGLR